MEIFEQPQKTPRAVELTPIEQTPKIPETVEADIFRQLQKIQEIVEANASRQAEQSKETKNPSEDRIVLLTDGIFAIALTLLVLSIPIPLVTGTMSNSEFNAALAKDFFSATLSYLITFAVLVAYWLGHRRLMNLIERVDLRFIEINLVFLAFVAFFPVTKSLLKDSDFPVTVVIYTAVLAGCGYSSALLWIYALGKHRLIAANADIRAPKYSIINALIYPTFFLLSLLLLLIPGMPSSDLFYAWLILPFIGIIYNRAVKSMDKTAVS